MPLTDANTFVVAERSITYRGTSLRPRGRPRRHGLPPAQLALDEDSRTDSHWLVAAKLAESEAVHRCVATQLFRYAYGRGESTADGCAASDEPPSGGSAKAGAAATSAASRARGSRTRFI